MRINLLPFLLLSTRLRLVCYSEYFYWFHIVYIHIAQNIRRIDRKLTYTFLNTRIPSYLPSIILTDALYEWSTAILQLHHDDEGIPCESEASPQQLIADLPVTGT